MPLPRFTFLSGLLAGLLLATVPVRAAAGGFTATLSADDQAKSGVSLLTPAERATLDQLVAGEVALARQPGTPGLGQDFVARRSAVELRQTGLDRLPPGQLTHLNELVAAALAAGPKPKERPRLRDSEVFAAPRPPEVHGSVSLTMGWGNGGSFRAGSLWVSYYDPTSRIGLDFGISSYRGSGYAGRCYPGFYGPGFYPDGPYSWNPGYLDGEPEANPSDSGLWHYPGPSLGRP